jgi:hypothetical protein
MNLPIVSVLVIAIIGLVLFGITETDYVEVVEEPGEDLGIDVVVIGVPSANLVETISGKEAQLKDIQYPINFQPDYITLEMLQNYDVVILQGDPFFNMNTREAIGDYIQQGGGVIVVGDAGSKHPEYSNVAGWAWPSGNGITVPAQLIGEWAGYSDVATGSDLRIADINHPIVQGMKLASSKLDAPSQVFKTVSKGSAIIAIDSSEGTVPAVIEGSSGQGKVIYFAYDPGQTPSLLLRTVEYLA